MKRFWKKPVVRITAAAVIVVALALLGLWVWSLRPPPEITFDFLNGRDVTFGFEEEFDTYPFKITTQYYSFEADFNDVCKATDAELAALDFEIDTSPRLGPKMRSYQSGTVTSNDLRLVTIFDGHRFRKSSKWELSRSLSSGRYEYEYNHGWVTVEIRHWQGRSWPPKYLLQRVILRLQSAGRQKP